MVKNSTVKNAKILLAVNDKSLSDKFCAFLSSNNNEIIKASDGVEVIKAIYSYQPDIVIADYNMPRLNGNYICRFPQIRYGNQQNTFLRSRRQSGNWQRVYSARLFHQS